MIFGLVLAGGRSRRFGREKAMAQIAGRPLIAHVSAVLAAGCDRVAINAAAGSGAAAFARDEGLHRLADAPSDPDGPLSGIKAGLFWARALGAEFLATSPCDTPFLPPDMVSQLFRARQPDRPAVAITRDGSQPLCALWPSSRADDLAAMTADGGHPAIRTVLGGLDPIEVVFEEAWRFDNLNTPGDYECALARERAS